jgi:hypothetical protein
MVAKTKSAKAYPKDKGMKPVARPGLKSMGPVKFKQTRPPRNSADDASSKALARLKRADVKI